MAKAKKPVKKFWQKPKVEPKVEVPVAEDQCTTEGCINPIAPGQTYVCVTHQKSR